MGNRVIRLLNRWKRVLEVCSLHTIYGAVRTPRPTTIAKVGRGVLTTPRIIIIVLLSTRLYSQAQTNVLYQNNFEKEQVGKVPEDFLVLDGGFAVKEEAGNKFLELPGSPLDSYSVQFGPTESSNIVISARIKSTAKGRRYPTFGVGLNGVAGYRLQLSPAKKLIELFKDTAQKASVPFDWKPGDWLNFRLQAVKIGSGELRIEGKIWTPGSPEPANWLVSFDEKEQPISGRPSVFGSPFAGTPIQFDDLRVERTSESAR